MWIENITAQGFRNLVGGNGNGEFFLELTPGINILSGANAQGKTNIIEAVYFCATLHSHRTHTVAEQIRLGEEFARLQANIARGGKDGYRDRINVCLKSAGKNRVSKMAAVNGMSISKLGDLLGVLYCVIFSPEDLGLIKSGPSERRRFMDMELCQINSIYYYELKQYYKILKQRNALLKSLKKSAENTHKLAETLDVWDQHLVPSTLRLVFLRHAYVEEISGLAAKIHMELCGEEFRAVYKPSANADEMPGKLKKNRQRDIQSGTTTVGIHKDDIQFLLNGLDSRIYGSQGQQRTAALSLKLAEVALIRREKGENPVLLLDDVMSELDGKRQEQLLSSIGGVQTFITLTSAENIHNFSPQKHTKNITEYSVIDGTVRRKT